MQKHEEARRKRDFEREQELEAKRVEKDMIERKRLYQLQATREAEDEKKKRLLTKFDGNEAYLAQVREARQREQRIDTEKKKIKKQLKLETAERIKRRQEYEREETVRKMEEDDRRTQDLQREREELIQQRRKAARIAKIRKDKVMEILEKSKMSGGKAGYKLQAIMNETTNLPPIKNSIPKLKIGRNPRENPEPMPAKQVGDLVNRLYPGGKKGDVRDGDQKSSSDTMPRKKLSPYLVDLSKTMAKK
jgi:hypothetical protein